MTIKIGGMEFTVPNGFKSVLWKDVDNGQIVYIIGTNDKAPWAYGPFTVHDKKARSLKNEKLGRVFYEFPESLLVKE